MNVIIKKVIKEEEETKSWCVEQTKGELGVGAGDFAVGFVAFLGDGSGLAAKCHDAHFGRKRNRRFFVVGLSDGVDGWWLELCGGAGRAVGDDGGTARAVVVGRAEPSDGTCDADSFVFGGQIGCLYPAWGVVGAFWLVDFAVAHDARLVADLNWPLYDGYGTPDVRRASDLSLFGHSAAQTNPAFYSPKL